MRTMASVGLFLMAALGFAFAQDTPTWIRGGQPTLRAREIIKVLEEAEAKGLDPWDYDGPRWASRLAAIEKSEQDLIQFDRALTEAALRYVSDMRDGRANSGVYRAVGRGSEIHLPDVVQQQVLDLRFLEPHFPGYWRTLEGLEKYRTLARNDDGERLPVVTKPVEPGDFYPGVPRVVRLLRALGDLPETALPDGSRIYSGPIVEAVKRFQGRHGLEVDGRIGRATISELNTPLRDRVRQLELVLERWRWLPRDFSRPPVLVNLPEFRLQALDLALNPVLEMKIVAGRARATPTPMLAGNLNQVIFRPYWNVPFSIQRKELLPEIKRDPGYLAAHNYEVTTSRGETVTAGPVSPDVLARLSSGEYVLRQVPGPKNALGLVKFLFPNTESVYLHDTPAKALFARVRRDFSHGCIRVEHAPELAAWLLRDEQAWSREGINAAMNGSETLEVKLKSPVPLMITYMTATVSETGEVRFFEDIYHYDADLEQQLAKRAVKLATSGVPGPRLHE